MKQKKIPEHYIEVKFLWYCSIDGDMFAAIDSDGVVEIFKGTKGNEF